ncbi:hypothetical protein ACA910_009100 [Epithemia clementina (nom. ined.)]
MVSSSSINNSNQTTASSSSSSKSVLIIGAKGALGQQCLHHLSREVLAPKIHIMCCNPTKLSKSQQALCTSIILGDARQQQDMERALVGSQADCVFLITGSGLDLSKKANTI